MNVSDKKNSQLRSLKLTLWPYLLPAYYDYLIVLEVILARICSLFLDDLEYIALLPEVTKDKQIKMNLKNNKLIFDNNINV